MKPNSDGDRTIPAEKRDILREPWRVDEPSVSEHVKPNIPERPGEWSAIGEPGVDQ